MIRDPLERGFVKFRDPLERGFDKFRDPLERGLTSLTVGESNDLFKAQTR